MVNRDFTQEFPVNTLQNKRLVSITRPFPKADLIEFLNYGQGQERVFWQNHHYPFAYAGFGAVITLSAKGTDRFRQIHRDIQALFQQFEGVQDAPFETSPRLFGGFSFFPLDQLRGIWSGFEPAHFVLPKFMLTRTDDQAWLTVCDIIPIEQAVSETKFSLEREYYALYEHLKTRLGRKTYDQSVLTDEQFPVSQEAWTDMISAAQVDMTTSPLEKVVLSRTLNLQFDWNVDPLVGLSALERDYFDCYRFLIEPIPNHSFFGATPELLVETRERDLITMALAGSRKRGASPIEDAAQARTLLNTPKERMEHAFVVEALRERISPHVEALEIPSTPQILPLKNIQHLYTPVHATLHQNEGVLRWVEQLHPTPAMGGTPPTLAQNAIQRLEVTPRGWYAAPVGWVDSHLDGIFAVGIRSAISVYENACLYAGAGIVPESDAQREWEETSLKFRPLYQALGASRNASAES